LSVILRGTVARKPFATGSKSEREAVVLTTPQGTYVLRRIDGNPFSDPELDVLVGKSIACEGELHGYTFIFTRAWEEPPGE
jgi:hypothetical protein